MNIDNGQKLTAQDLNVTIKLLLNENFKNEFFVFNSSRI